MKYFLLEFRQEDNLEKKLNREIHYHGIKEHPKVSKSTKLVVKCCKFANFVSFCMTHRKLTPLSRKRYQFLGEDGQAVSRVQEMARVRGV